MAYNLGPVKSWVQGAAEEIGAKFGVRNIGGWRSSGSVPNSDHPKGRALDVMTADRAKGDAIAAYAIANAKRLGITYVIWHRRIWQNGRWSAYSGPSPHTDHVHLSFQSTKPAGGPFVPAVDGPGLGNLVPDTITGAIANIGKELAGIGSSVANVGKVAETATKLFLPSNMLRAAMGLFGTIFVLIGIWFLSREIRE